MKKSVFLKVLAAATLVCTFASSAMAQEEVQKSTTPFTEPRKAERNEWKPDIGVLAGVATPEGSYNTSGEFGVTASIQPFIPFSVGAELTRVEFDAEEGDSDLERTTLLFKAAYNFGGTVPVIRYSYIGVGVGPYFKSDGTDVASAPLLGFDIPIQQEDRGYLSLGASAKYLVVSGSEPDAVSVNGVVKYWY